MTHAAASSVVGGRSSGANLLARSPLAPLSLDRFPHVRPARFRGGFDQPPALGRFSRVVVQRWWLLCHVVPLFVSLFFVICPSSPRPTRRFAVARFRWIVVGGIAVLSAKLAAVVPVQGKKNYHVPADDFRTCGARAADSGWSGRCLHEPVGGARRGWTGGRAAGRVGAWISVS